MAMGIVSNEDFEKELVSLNVPLSNLNVKVPTPEIIEKVVDINRGRGNKPEVPESIRALIAEESLSGTPAKVLSNTFGVSESSVSAYKHDATSTASYHSPDRALTEANNEVRNTITSEARNKLIAAIRALDDEKISKAKARDISGIAKDMSTVIKNMEPVHQVTNNQQVIVYRPRMKEEEDFDVIEVNE